MYDSDRARHVTTSQWPKTIWVSFPTEKKKDGQVSVRNLLMLMINSALNLEFNKHCLIKTRPTGFSRVNTEALVPETTDQDVAVVGSNHKTVCVDLDALVHQVSDLTLVHA